MTDGVGDYILTSFLVVSATVCTALCHGAQRQSVVHKSRKSPLLIWVISASKQFEGLCDRVVINEHT